MLAHDKEKFYSQMWKSDEWGTKEINLDEQVRSQAIIKLIEEFIVPNSGSKKTLKIVDAGCGRGWLTAMLKIYGDVIGIDTTSAAIRRGKELFPECQFVCEDTTTLVKNVGACSFDLVVSTEVIEHIPDESKSGFMQSIYELIAFGGFAILTTPRGELWDAWEKKNKEKQPIEEWIEEKDLIKLCKDAGFEIFSHRRIFLPGFQYNLITKIINSRFVRRQMKKNLWKKLFSGIADNFGIYQIIILKKI
jgi:2-polyprenyl-3-methyl-5-hydroxy-6-metoxy-1,4-benzoquinol methylase